MITAIFSIIINWFLIQSIFSIALILYDKPIYGIPAQTAYIIISVCIMGALLLISLTPVGEIILRFLTGCKKGKAEDRQKIQNLFNEVCISAAVNPLQYNLYIAESQKSNAWALGSKTVAVTQGLLFEANDMEIKGVLAHEVGHLVLGHTLWITLTYASGQIGYFILQIYVLITKICSLLSYIPFVGLITVPIIWGIAISLKLFQWFITIPFSVGMMFGSRRDEYAADKFTAQIGFGAGLHSYLSRIAARYEKSEGFFERLHSTHPRVEKRLKRLANSHA